MKKFSFKEQYIIRGHYFDLVIIIGVFLFIHFIHKINPFPLNANNEDILISLLSSIISLIGFGAAALTIIVTFRANYLSKNSDQKKPTNFLEFMVLGRSYLKISQVFKNTLIEFVVASSAIYTLWLFPFFYSQPIRMLYLIVIGLVCLISPCIRILYTLFNLIGLENKPFEQE